MRTSVEKGTARPTVRVATYNLYLGADLAPLFDVDGLDQLARRVAEVRRQLATTRFPERAEAIAALFAREQLDVVGVQELTRWSSSKILRDGTLGPDEVVSDFLPELLAALVAAGTPYDAHAVNHNFHGTLPVSGHEQMGIAGANAVLVRRGGPVRVAGEATAVFDREHLMPTRIDGVSFPIHRSYGWIDAVVDGRVDGEADATAWRFANTHTEAYDEAARNAQRDELLAAIGEPGVPVVIAGDFNARPDRVGVGVPYADAWAVAGGDPAAGFTCGQGADLTNEESLLDERIDYLWMRDATVRECRLFGDRPGDRSRARGLWPSDHAGVLARLEF